jgi:hypothetical protein
MKTTQVDNQAHAECLDCIWRKFDALPGDCESHVVKTKHTVAYTRETRTLYTDENK